MGWVSRKIDHESWSFKKGDLVATIKEVAAIPDNFPVDITMHEGNTPRLKSDTIGSVTGMLGDDQDRWPIVFLLVGERKYGVAGIHLKLVQRSQEDTD